MKRSGAVLNEVCSLAINHHKLLSSYNFMTTLIFHKSENGKNLHNNTILRSNMKCCAITDGKLGCSSGGKVNSHLHNLLIIQLTKHIDFIRLCSSLQCYQSSTWSTIIPLFNTIHEKLVHQMLKTKEFFK
ncbi:hypothetical protein T03_1029 [Trichinella britovi]|uniref:Uncharacterized protein n=1 Tax=Trichinella britovi TaxID=45882 RepID=A0A0V1DBW0_TRIBR|nr:hypothetical protein T03_1029 [Trichinella britovi]